MVGLAVQPARHVVKSLVGITSMSWWLATSQTVVDHDLCL